MRLFWELTLRSFQRQLTYRAAVLAGLATNFFFGILRASVLVALYGARQEVVGITVLGAVTYTGISQATIGILSLFGWYELMNTVYTGAVASDLLKPMGYYRFWLAQDMGRAGAQFLLRGLPILLGYALLYQIVVPADWIQWFILALSLFLAWWISFSWRFLANLMAFWTPDARGFIRFAFIFTWLFSGFLMPLRFFPDWFTHLCYLTPFPYLVNVVVDIYLGLLEGPALLQALLAQLGWAVALTLLGQGLLRAGVRRLVILGG